LSRKELKVVVATPAVHIKLIIFLWFVAIITVASMAFAGPCGWDADVYWKAIQAVHHGQDPYAIGLAAQQAFHDRAHSPTEHAPFAYVYSPITLPFCRFLGMFPGWLLAPIYLGALAAGIGLTLWAGFQMAAEHERRWLKMVLPFVVLFPGLLTDDVILSGNMAYILNGLILAAAVRGWKDDRWAYFYAAVLFASIFKAPLLTMLAISVLVGRRQWGRACSTGALGLLLFAAQVRIWPELFREYLIAVRLQFDWNHDFGFGPAGVLSKILCQMGKPYNPAATILYLAFAAVLGTVLLFLAHRVRQGKLPQQVWIPIAIIGTILLNPRIKEYDVAAITIPMLLIVWRTLGLVLNYFPREVRDSRLSEAIRPSAQSRPDFALLLAGSGWFCAFNVIAATVEWKPTELGLLLGIFSMGVWSLYRTRHELRKKEHEPARAPVH